MWLELRIMNTDILIKYPLKNDANPARVIDGEAVIVTPGDSLLHSLNEQATFIWELTDGVHTVSDIAELMCKHYEVDAARAQQDLLEFVEACVQKDLLTLQDVASESQASSEDAAQQSENHK